MSAIPIDCPPCPVVPTDTEVIDTECGQAVIYRGSDGKTYCYASDGARGQWFVNEIAAPDPMRLCECTESPCRHDGT